MSAELTNFKRIDASWQQQPQQSELQREQHYKSLQQLSEEIQEAAMSSAYENINFQSEDAIVELQQAMNTDNGSISNSTTTADNRHLISPSNTTPDTNSIENDNAKTGDELSSVNSMDAGTTMTTSAADNRDLHSSAPDEQFTVKWTNLSYVVRSPWYSFSESRVALLDSLSGSFKSGELTAILGPSGSGKSTLVNCLLGKVDFDRGLCGETRVSFANKQVERERRSRRPLKIAVIPQQDHLFDRLTVLESLRYASRIKNVGLSNKEHEKNVKRVLEQLSLKQCENNLCGSISGGQYKRVSIAAELLSWPDILILDEPTSGLDSITCFQVVNALKNLVKTSPHPLAVVLTIHQPDVEVFALFEKIYVLARGGKAIYEGGPGDIFHAITDGCEAVQDQRESTRRQEKIKKELQMSKKQPTNLMSILNNFEANRIQGGSRIDITVQDDSTDPPELHTSDDDEEVAKPSQLVIPKDMDAASIAESQRLRAMGIHDNYPKNLIELEQACRTQSGNPARLIVSVAAQEFDYELISTMNSRQKQRHTNKLSLISTNLFKERRKVTKLDPLLDISLANRRLANQRPATVFWKHLWVHAERSTKTLVRDPLLCSLQYFLHIAVPLMISYCFQKHDINGCPHFEKIDLIEEAYSNGTESFDKINTEIRFAIEAQGYFFIQLYVIIFAAICGYSLTYPLSMHVIMKEYRNGWYSVASYFWGRTLSDIPVCASNVVLALSISYFLTGQAHSSPFEWRFASLAALAVLATLVAQTQGLIFGAMFLDSPQSTVFIAPASTAPLVIISGFLIRLDTLPGPLRFASNISYFTHLLAGALISRYGFGLCECDPSQFSTPPLLEDANNATSTEISTVASNLTETVATTLAPYVSNHDIPMRERGYIDLWVGSYALEYNSTTTPDLIGKLTTALQKAKTFGVELKSCEDVKPFALVDNKLNDSDLQGCFIALIGMLVGFRILCYLILHWKMYMTA